MAKQTPEGLPVVKHETIKNYFLERKRMTEKEVIESKLNIAKHLAEHNPLVIKYVTASAKQFPEKEQMKFMDCIFGLYEILMRQAEENNDQYELPRLAEETIENFIARVDSSEEESIKSKTELLAHLIEHNPLVLGYVDTTSENFSGEENQQNYYECTYGLYEILRTQAKKDKGPLTDIAGNLN